MLRYCSALRRALSCPGVSTGGAGVGGAVRGAVVGGAVVGGVVVGGVVVGGAVVGGVVGGLVVVGAVLACFLLPASLVLSLLLLPPAIAAITNTTATTPVTICAHFGQERNARHVRRKKPGDAATVVTEASGIALGGGSCSASASVDATPPRDTCSVHLLPSQ
jgi:hypothetical protein